MRLRRLFIAVILLGGFSCGTTPSGGDGATPDAGDEIWWGALDGRGDGSPTEVSAEDLSGPEVEVFAEVSLDAADTGGLCLVEGGFGCPCAGPDDCLEGWCVDSPRWEGLHQDLSRGVPPGLGLRPDRHRRGSGVHLRAPSPLDLSPLHHE